MKLDAKDMARFRRICLALPGATEKQAWGHPTFRIGDKMFAAAGTGHGGPHIAFCVADPTLPEKDARFQPIPYPGRERWLFYFFNERPDDWDSIRTLIAVSWERIFATLPKKKQDAILAPSRATASTSKAKRPASRRKRVRRSAPRS